MKVVTWFSAVSASRLASIMIAFCLILVTAHAATFTVNCANDPYKGVGHQDFRYLAAVHHEALDGQADTHPACDTCPRPALPGGVDPNPDPNKPLKDKGCGKKDKATSLIGADVLTDVVQKS